MERRLSERIERLKIERVKLEQTILNYKAAIPVCKTKFHVEFAESQISEIEEFIEKIDVRIDDLQTIIREMNT